MQFMNVFPREPGKTAEIMETRAREEIPEGVTVIDEWVDSRGTQVFPVIETDDPVALMKLGFPWSGLGYRDAPGCGVKRSVDYSRGMRRGAPYAPSRSCPGLTGTT